MKLKKPKETAIEMSSSLFPNCTEQEHEKVAVMLLAHSQFENFRLSKINETQRRLAETYIRLALEIEPKIIHEPQELYAYVLLGELIRRKELPEMNHHKEIPKWKRLLTSYRHWW
ncbi:hypothetical protein [Vibrio sonorensis]|uniref:hypothetical protein n=1 Tax=Vibrio sonorensis TaxID=1004316 RepID=UPI0008D9DF68|nr:hypothetical protein [Vibrio sonorensis]